MARMNITDVHKFGERAVDRAYLITTKHKLCAKRIRVKFLTQRYSTFEDIVRKSQQLFNVQVYRNTSSIEEGIYVCGRENFVDEYIKWIEMVITRVEKDTWQYGNPLKVRGKVHGNMAYSKYASKKARSVLYTVFDLIEYRDSIYTPEILQRCIMDTLLTNIYCKELSILKNKTKYNGELRNIDPKDR